MEKLVKETIWKQFGATIEMLENAIVECPPELWDTEEKFWHKAFHALFFLDYYLSAQPQTFSPPAPFTLSEFDPSGALPERVYTKNELLAYAKHCYKKCHKVIVGLDEASAKSRWVNDRKDYSRIEILIYNMRHVQHHAAQLNLIMRLGANKAPGWVSRSKTEL